MKFEEKILWRGGVKKKRHGHNIDFWGLKRIARSSNMVGRTCYSFQTSKLKIVAVSFFLNTTYFRWRISFFRLIHLWRPITPVKNVTRPISPTFSESSGRQLSHGPSLDIGFFEQILRNERFMKKMQKNGFFQRTLISWHLLKEANIQARSMWNLTSWQFRKCGGF